MNSFEIAIQVELTIAEIYRQLGFRFADDSELKALFALLRQEELAHARRIEQFREATSPDDKRLTTFEEQFFRPLLEQAEAALAAIRAGQHLTAIEALQTAVGLERNFDVLHAEALAKTDYPELVALFKDLSQADRAHADALDKVAQRRTPSS